MKIFKIEKQNNKIRLYLFGIRVLSLTKKKLLNPFKKPFLRNDDMSVDTHLLDILYHHYIDGAVPHAVYVLQSIGR